MCERPIYVRETYICVRIYICVRDLYMCGEEHLQLLYVVLNATLAFLVHGLVCVRVNISMF